ncbi:hypothetical protein ACWIUD_07425 [Helicobacter sp. 23-1044]
MRCFFVIVRFCGVCVPSLREVARLRATSWQSIFLNLWIASI